MYYLKKRYRNRFPKSPPANIVAEPVGRDTAPCIGLAATIIHKKTPDSVMIVMAADHVIEPASRFVKMAETAMNIVGKNNSLLTMGVMTTRIAGGLTSPKRALLPASLKGIPNNFSMTIARCVVSDRL